MNLVEAICNVYTANLCRIIILGKVLIYVFVYVWVYLKITVRISVLFRQYELTILLKCIVKILHLVSADYLGLGSSGLSSGGPSSAFDVI